jgi:endonuclease/exonuclease/phosphatase family metal-dependent hydrolase
MSIAGFSARIDLMVRALVLLFLAAGCGNSMPPTPLDQRIDRAAPDRAAPDLAADRPIVVDQRPPDLVLADLPPPDRGWPPGFTPTAVNVPAGHLCNIPSDYVAKGGDPVNPPCDVEADTLSDRDPATVPLSLKVVAWNVEYGKQADAIRKALLKEPDLVNADILLLQEVPRYDGESNPPKVNLAREIAVELKMNYVFAVEWDRRLKAAQAGEHGCVVLSKYRIGNVTQIRHTPLWNFYGEKQDFGGRMTLGVDIVVGAARYRVYSSHLCTRDYTGAGRAKQGAEIRKDAALPTQPVTKIVGGDLNTFLCNPTIQTCYAPPWAEPVVKDFLADGWTDLLPKFGSWTELGIGVLPQRLDWVFGKGVTHVSHAVLQQVRPADHVPLVATFTVP